MTTIATAADLSQAMRDLPWSDLSPVIGLGLIGLGLWIVGRRFLRAGLVLAGLLIGATLGWVAWELFVPPFTPWILVGIGAILLACLAILTFRFAVAGTLAIVLGLAAPAAVWTFDDFQGVADMVQQEAGETETPPEASPEAPPEAPPDEVLDPEGLASDLAEGFIGTEAGQAVADEFLGIDIDKQDVYDAAKENLPKLRGYSDWAIKKVSGVWEQSPPELRPQMIAASVIGVLVGFILGAFLPTLSSSVVTSFGGAMLLLICLQVVNERLGGNEGWWVPAKATQWLVLWLITSIIGIGIQWTIRAKPADNAA